MTNYGVLGYVGIAGLSLILGYLLKVRKVNDESRSTEFRYLKEMLEIQNKMVFDLSERLRASDARINSLMSENHVLTIRIKDLERNKSVT